MVEVIEDSAERQSEKSLRVVCLAVRLSLAYLIPSLIATSSAWMLLDLCSIALANITGVD